VVTLRSGETDQPVAGARVAISGQSQAGSFNSNYTTDASGQFALDRAVFLTPTPLVEASAAGFVVRVTLLKQDETTISLWPSSSPTGLDDEFSSTVAFSGSSCPAVNNGQAPLRRASVSAPVVQVTFGPTLQDAAAETAHQIALTRLNTATAGAPRYEFTSSPSPGGVVFTAEIDPAAATCTAGPEPLRAATALGFTNGNINGGRLIYCTVDAARSVALVMHELGHTVGLYHSASTADIMYCSAGRPVQFSQRERLVMKLLRLRRSGTRWPDNDRTTTSPAVSPSGATEVIACGDR
jgi:hypothetical protein